MIQIIITGPPARALMIWSSHLTTLITRPPAASSLGWGRSAWACAAMTPASARSGPWPAPASRTWPRQGHFFYFLYPKETLYKFLSGVAVRGRGAGSPSLLRQAGCAHPVSAAVSGGAPGQHRGQLPGLPPQHRPGGHLLRGGHHQPPAPRQVGDELYVNWEPDTNTLRNLHAVSVTDGGAILTWGPGSNGDSDDEEVSVIIVSDNCHQHILFRSGNLQPFRVSSLRSTTRRYVWCVSQ